MPEAGSNGNGFVREAAHADDGLTGSLGYIGIHFEKT